VQACHLEAFQTFVTGVQQDKDAVLAGLTLPWSNGPLEGNVNRLKLIKRSMYGRAEIDLLKLRVLHRSKASQDRKDKKKKKQGQQAALVRLAKRHGNAQQLVLRAKIVLAANEEHSNAEIARRLLVSVEIVRLWRDR